MTIDNLTTLETKLNSLVEKMNGVIRERDTLKETIDHLQHKIEDQDRELSILQAGIDETSKIEETNRIFHEERDILKRKTLDLLVKIEQLESLFEQTPAPPADDGDSNDSDEQIDDDDDSYDSDDDQMLTRNVDEDPLGDLNMNDSLHQESGRTISQQQKDKRQGVLFPDDEEAPRDTLPENV